MSVLNVGLVGCGNVGTEFVRVFDERRDGLAQRTGIELVLSRIAVANLDKPRPAHITARQITDNALDIVEDPQIDLVVELIGGSTDAREIVLAALRAGKSVVTGNKELIASFGAELYAQAAESKVDLLFEAAAVAAVPIVRSLRESLVGEHVLHLIGIFNGTTNYILTRMSRENMHYSAALEMAQAHGYAEPDPTADVGGADSAAKLAILASLAFNRGLTIADVDYEGIASIERVDIDVARSLDYAIKLIGFAEVVGDGGSVRAKVMPALIPMQHPLAAVSDTFNAVYVHGQDSGDLMFYGQGAGRRPTASALMGDLTDAAMNRAGGVSRPLLIDGRATIDDGDGMTAPYYLRLEIDDHPGALSKVSGVLARYAVSIRVVEQHDTPRGTAQLVFLTHGTTESAFNAAVEDLAGDPDVLRIGRAMPILCQQ